MQARVLQYPEHFDNVARIKELVTGEPVLPGDSDLWILGSPLIIEIDELEQVDVPIGFTTDGASVPDVAQVFTGWNKWDQPQRYPAIVHDWMYCQPGVTKCKADKVFYSLLRSEGANLFQSGAMYSAVVVGGHWAYQTDQEQGPAIFA